ncbi:MAG: biopolymer transporter ExbD [Planctomycetes bacterium]|nr:biopolymer transporter ExbD [Planctomycetota bacterium]
MRRLRPRFPELGVAMDLTPMIDIVFQLLIFFAITAAFLPEERVLLADLPETGGSPEALDLPPLAEVNLYLDWIEDPAVPAGGYCVASTSRFKAAGGGYEERHRFRNLDPGQEGGRPPGGRAAYSHPDFREIQAYLHRRQEEYAPAGFELPVTIHFGEKVPVQMIISLFDLYREEKIRSVALSADSPALDH